jgi:tetratricopeptide (TPR) repeat protein
MITPVTIKPNTGDRLDSAEDYVARGDVFCGNQDYDPAIQDFDNPINLQAGFPQSYANCGKAYLRNGSINIALADYHGSGKNPVGILAKVLL